MSVARLRVGEWIAAVAAIVLVAGLFALHWYGGADPRDGWQALPTLRWWILVDAAVGLVAALAQARRGPAVAAALDVVALVLASLTVLLLAIRLATTGASLAAGAFVGLAASIALLAGVFLALRAEQGWAPGPERPVEVVRLGPDQSI
jgi:peptidoglycan/LPS O-acetylase OafA/YrhL